MESTYRVKVSRPCTVYVIASGRSRVSRLNWMDRSWRLTSMECRAERIKHPWLVWRKEVTNADEPLTLGSDTRSVRGASAGGDSVNYVFVPKKAEAAKPAPPLPANQVYLVDLKPKVLSEENSKLVEIGKNLEVRGRLYPKCITARPRRYQAIGLVCDLGGKYAKLEFETASLGTAKTTTFGFYVFVGDKEIFKTFSRGKRSISVKGLKQILLKVYTGVQPPAGARGVWLSPRLVRAGTGAAPAPGGKRIRLLPEADASVRTDEGWVRTANRGKNPDLRPITTGAGGAYLRFDLREVRGQVASAQLRLHASGGQGAGGDEVYEVRLVEDNSWDEMKITGANAPAPAAGDPLGTFTGRDRSPAVNVTAAVRAAAARGARKITLLVIGSKKNKTGFGWLNIVSREGAADKRPQLIIELEKPAAPSPAK
jgi:hypothetical protein